MPTYKVRCSLPMPVFEYTITAKDEAEAESKAINKADEDYDCYFLSDAQSGYDWDVTIKA